MNKTGLGLKILLSGLVTTLVVGGVMLSTQAQTSFFHLGLGAGLTVPDELISHLTVLGELSLTDWLKMRTDIEFSSLFGIVLLPIEELILLQLGGATGIYFGGGGGVLLMLSEFGRERKYTLSGVAGIKIAVGSMSFFSQLKLRSFIKDGAIDTNPVYQVDIGMIF